MGYLRTGWRRFQRVIPRAERPVRVEVRQPSLMGGAVVCDISEGGVELALPKALDLWAIGTPVAFDLHLAELGTVAATGEVRHVDGRLTGIVFQELAPGGAELIRRYVQRQVREASFLTRLRRLLHA